MLCCLNIVRITRAKEHLPIDVFINYRFVFRPINLNTMSKFINTFYFIAEPMNIYQRSLIDPIAANCNSWFMDTFQLFRRSTFLQLVFILKRQPAV